MNEFDKGMARRALFLLKGAGASFDTNRVAESARKILDGSGSQIDVDNVRAFTGDRRSGAGGVKGLTRGIRGAVGRFTGIGNAISMAEIAQERGSGTAAATAGLYRQVESLGLDALKSKGVRGLAKAVASVISDDPALSGRFLKSIGRGVRLGGAIGQGLLMALGLAEDVVAGRQKLAQAQSRISDASRAFYSDPEITRRSMQSAFGLSRGQAFFGSQQAIFGGAPDILKEYLESRVAADAEQRHKAELSLRESARKDLAAFGIDPNNALGVMARSRGVAPELLNEQERNEGLDTPFDAYLRGLQNSAQAQREAEGQYRKLSDIERLKLAAGGGVEARMGAWRRDWALRQARSRLLEGAARQRTGDAYLASLSPLERGQKALREEQATREAAAYRSRHQVVEVD